MADNLELDYDEIVIRKETSVAHGGVMALYTDVLILTNKKIICLSKGLFGGTKKVYHYPLNQIKVVNGIPQVQQGKLTNGTPCLDIYLYGGEEHFNFGEKNKKTISIWIKEIHKLFGNNVGSVGFDYDDSVLGAFKEVGEELKDVGREVAEAFGFKVQDKQQSNRKNKGLKAIAKSAISDIYCTSCGKSIAPDSKFCSYCGTQIGVQQAAQFVPRETVCPACGAKMNPGSKFCTECGAEIRLLPNNDSNFVEDDSIEEKLGIYQQLELLQKLKSLLDAGVISQDEFEKKKREIL